MSYIGTPPSNAFTSLLKQDFSTSATTGYTLDHAVNNANDIALFINFVRQEPTAGYAASGTTLTLTSATASSDDMYCVYLGQALQTVNPANASVGLSQLTATGTKNSTTFLRGDNTFASAGGTNTPAFEATMSSDQTISDSSNTKVAFAVETFDTDNAYDTSAYRFTPQTSGKYHVYSSINCFQDDASDLKIASIKIYKNGSVIFETHDNMSNNYLRGLSQNFSATITLNGSSDYLEIFTFIEISSGVNNLRIESGGGGGNRTVFGAYKIIE